LKKRSKKRLLLAGSGNADANAPSKQKFFASFFQKEALACLP
jgi:hypothetical protein